MLLLVHLVLNTFKLQKSLYYCNKKPSYIVIFRLKFTVHCNTTWQYFFAHMSKPIKSNVFEVKWPLCSGPSSTLLLRLGISKEPSILKTTQKRGGTKMAILGDFIDIIQVAKEGMGVVKIWKI